MPSASNQVLTNERLLVEAIKGWAGNSVIGDDCALLSGGILVTTDTLVEGTHFRLQWTSARNVGWKSCAVNLSDIAAMAGRARDMVVALTVPPEFERSDFRQFYAGFLECARTYRARLVGGDLTRGPVFVIGVTAIGYVHENGCLMRRGARPGDAVIVTGDFGASAAGFWLLQNGCDSSSRKRFALSLARHERPEPRLCESWALVRRTGNRGALMDASDGLADAVAQIAYSSNVAIAIDYDAIPVHAETAEICKLAGVELSDWVLYGGEDYELVATVPEEIWQKWQHEPDNPFVCIGKVSEGSTIRIESRAQGEFKVNLSKCFQQIDWMPDN